MKELLTVAMKIAVALIALAWTWEHAGPFVAIALVWLVALDRRIDQAEAAQNKRTDWALQQIEGLQSAVGRLGYENADLKSRLHEVERRMPAPGYVPEDDGWPPSDFNDPPAPPPAPPHLPPSSLPEPPDLPPEQPRW